MALLSPKQLAQATAVTGDTLEWDGRVWSPTDALRLAVCTQGQLIAALIRTLREERIDLPEELEGYDEQA